MAALLRGRPSAALRPDAEVRLGSWDGRACAALAALGPVDEPSAARRRAAALREGRIEMLGRSAALPDVWPDSAAHGPLFRYHLQYHDALAEAVWADEADPALAALDLWMRRWSDGGSPAWDPYPASVRLVNWMRIVGAREGRLPPELAARIRTLLAAHVDRLERHPEIHLQANHLLRNRWALALGARCWTAGSGLAPRARDAFFAELLAQVGGDGLHEERSPMYHVRALRDALELVAVLHDAGESVPEDVRRRVRAMAEAAAWLRRADGGLFLLNDAAADHGVDVDRALQLAAALVGYAPARPEGLRHFTRGRIAVFADARAGDRLLVDLGGPSPEHQPAHAHAGALGVDLDLGGVPLFADPGCSGYDGDPFRPYFRGTRAHGTATLDGRDQSEMWATFRVARRARVRTDRVEAPGGRLRVEGACSPYHDPSAWHFRTVERVDRTVAVEDRVAGGAGKRVDVHWHLRPDWSAAPQGDSVVLSHPSGTRATLAVAGADELTLHRAERDPELGWSTAGFGRVVPTWTVRARVARNDGRTLRAVVRPVER